MSRHLDTTREVDSYSLARSCRSCTNGVAGDDNGYLWRCLHPATHRLALVCFTCAAGVQWTTLPNGSDGWGHAHAEPRNHPATPVPASWFFRWTHQVAQARAARRPMPRPGAVVRGLLEELGRL